MAKIIMPGGIEEEVDGEMTFERAKKLIGCDTMQIVETNDHRMMGLDEDGTFNHNLKQNRAATALLTGRQAVDPDRGVVGIVIVGTPAEMGYDVDEEVE